MSTENETGTRSEADSPRTAIIFVMVLAGAFLLTGVVLAIDQFFDITLRSQIEEKVLKPESAALRQLRSEEEARLTRYQWVDRKAGVVRIPVARARELVLAEWADRPSGYVPGTSGGTPSKGTESK